jgi:hypothetical protein
MNRKAVDGFNFMSKFTIRRMRNATKVVSSYYWSKWSKSPIQWGFPISITMEPTRSCNLRCPEWPSGKREFSWQTVTLRKYFFKDTIDDLHKDIAYFMFYFQGDPFLNTKFLAMVNYASLKKYL